MSNRVSDLPGAGAIQVGDLVPIAREGVSYKYDLGTDMLARPTSETLATPSGASLVGFQQAGTGAVETDVRAKARLVLHVNDFGAAGDNVADDTGAVRAAILRAAEVGGGTVLFGASGAGYYVQGPVYVPPGVHVDLNGQTLRGGAGDMFQSGKFVGGVVSSNVADALNVNIVQNASIRNGRIINANRCFNLKNWNQECVIADITTRDCLAVGYYKYCFSMSLINVTARGGSSVLTPTHHFDTQTNSVVLDRVKSVTEWPMRFSGGANAIRIEGCEFEGGAKGVVMEGDNLAISLSGNYFEAISGAGIDVSTAGACSFDIRGNYFNAVGTAFKHGTAGTATLAGEWAADNELVNTVPGPLPVMEVRGPRNFMTWNDSPVDDPNPGVPVNWLIDKSTIYVRDQRWNADALSDVRAVTRYHGAGIVPMHYAGDTGDPFLGSVPFCTATYPASGTATITVDTEIVWRPNSMLGRFVFSITDDGAPPFAVFGDFFGGNVALGTGSAAGKTVTASDNGGFLRLSIGTFNNASGIRTITGTVRLV